MKKAGVFLLMLGSIFIWSDGSHWPWINMFGICTFGAGTVLISEGYDD